MRSIELSVQRRMDAWLAQSRNVLRRNLVPLDRRFGSLATGIDAPVAAAAAAVAAAASRVRIARFQGCKLRASASYLSARLLSTPRRRRRLPVLQSPPPDRDKLQIAGRGAWSVLIVSPASCCPRRPSAVQQPVKLRPAGVR